MELNPCTFRSPTFGVTPSSTRMLDCLGWVPVTGPGKEGRAHGSRTFPLFLPRPGGRQTPRHSLRLLLPSPRDTYETLLGRPRCPVGFPTPRSPGVHFRLLPFIRVTCFFLETTKEPTSGVVWGLRGTKEVVF